MWSRFSYITDLYDCTMKLLQDCHGRTFQKTQRIQISCRDLRKAAKTSIAPQRERSDRRKDTRGLRERHQNSHHATTRAIRHAQSHEMAARADNRFSPNTARTMKNEHWKSEKRCFTYIGFSHVFVEVYTAQYCAWHEKSEVPQHGIIIMSQIKNHVAFDAFKTSSHVHQILRLPRKMTSKTTTWTHACQCFSNIQKVSRLPCGWISLRCPAPITHNRAPDLKMPTKCHAFKKGRTSKNERRAPLKVDFGRYQTGAHTLPLRSKCSWTSHKGTCVRAGADKSQGPQNVPWWSNPDLVITPERNPKQCAGRKSNNQIQATATMEQQQTRLDVIVTAAAGTCFAQEATLCLLIRTSYQNLIPGH